MRTLGVRKFTEVHPDEFALTEKVRADPALCRDAIATAEERIVTLAREIQDEVTDLGVLGVPEADLSGRMLALVKSVWTDQRHPTGAFVARCEASVPHD